VSCSWRWPPNSVGTCHHPPLTVVAGRRWIASVTQRTASAASMTLHAVRAFGRVYLSLSAAGDDRAEHQPEHDL
jgi:hypothetical protein